MDNKYFIRGSYNRGKEVINLLKEKGGNNAFNLFGDGGAYIYYISDTGTIEYTFYTVNSAILLKNVGYQELTLPNEKYEPKHGDPVLVRNTKSGRWIEGVFSFYSEDEELYWIVGGSGWIYCIPFDEDKLGKVTEEND